MKYKIMMFLIFVGLLVNAYCGTRYGNTWVPDTKWEEIVYLFQITLPLLMFIGAPIILVVIIVIVASFVKYLWKLSYSLIGRE